MPMTARSPAAPHARSHSCRAAAPARAWPSRHAAALSPPLPHHTGVNMSLSELPASCPAASALQNSSLTRAMAVLSIRLLAQSTTCVLGPGWAAWRSASRRHARSKQTCRGVRRCLDMRPGPAPSVPLPCCREQHVAGGGRRHGGRALRGAPPAHVSDDGVLQLQPRRGVRRGGRPDLLVHEVVLRARRRVGKG